LVNISKCLVKVWKSFFVFSALNFSTPRGTGVAGSSLLPLPSPWPGTGRNEMGVSTGEGMWSGVSMIRGVRGLVRLGPASVVGIGICG
jgi:hypothetical protein